MYQYTHNVLCGVRCLPHGRSFACMLFSMWAVHTFTLDTFSIPTRQSDTVRKIRLLAWNGPGQHKDAYVELICLIGGIGHVVCLNQVMSKALKDFYKKKGEGLSLMQVLVQASVLG